MRGVCSKCGKIAEVIICEYCSKPFCRDDYDQHMLWEKRHEGLESQVKKRHLKRTQMP